MLGKHYLRVHRKPFPLSQNTVGTHNKDCMISALSKHIMHTYKTTNPHQKKEKNTAVSGWGTRTDYCCFQNELIANPRELMQSDLSPKYHAVKPLNQQKQNMHLHKKHSKY
uniref:Uncharacterized protein n=1 Tax=Opuntia streptacantha TaxID=393608 RepID=A0A7C9AA34_OPUST